MDTNKRSSKRNNHKDEKKSSGIMKFFYLIMLVLIISTSVISLAGANHRNAIAQSAVTPTPNNPPVRDGGTSALVLVLHREDSSSGKCVDLTITFTGSAVYSDCSNGVNIRYTLSASEQTQLHDWINQFQPINYDHTDKTQAGNVTNKLYLNGQGSQQAGETNTQQIIDFAMALATKIASQP